MENKWIDRCMMCLEVLMNFLVIFCLETVILVHFLIWKRYWRLKTGSLALPVCSGSSCLWQFRFCFC